jgi:predicted transcriptional regulator
MNKPLGMIRALINIKLKYENDSFYVFDLVEHGYVKGNPDWEITAKGEEILNLLQRRLPNEFKNL